MKKMMTVQTTCKGEEQENYQLLRQWSCEVNFSTYVTEIFYLLLTAPKIESPIQAIRKGNWWSEIVCRMQITLPSTAFSFPIVRHFEFFLQTSAAHQTLATFQEQPKKKLYSPAGSWFMFMVQVHVCHATEPPSIAWQQSKDRGSNDFGMRRFRDC